MHKFPSPPTAACTLCEVGRAWGRTGPGSAWRASRNASGRPGCGAGKPSVYSATSAKLRHMMDNCLVGAMSLAAYRRSTAWRASTSHTSAGKLSVGMMPSCKPQGWRAQGEGQQRMLPQTGRDTLCLPAQLVGRWAEGCHLHPCCLTDSISY